MESYGYLRINDSATDWSSGQETKFFSSAFGQPAAHRETRGMDVTISCTDLLVVVVYELLEANLVKEFRLPSEIWDVGAFTSD